MLRRCKLSPSGNIRANKIGATTNKGNRRRLGDAAHREGRRFRADKRMENEMDQRFEKYRFGPRKGNISPLRNGRPS